VKVPVATTAKGRTGVAIFGKPKTPGAVQVMLSTKIFIVIGGVASGLPVIILDTGHTVALTTHVACKVSIISVKTRIIRQVMPHPYHGGRVISMMKAGGIVGTFSHHVAFEAALAATVRSIYGVKVTVAGFWIETSTRVSGGNGNPLQCVSVITFTRKDIVPTCVITPTGPVGHRVARGPVGSPLDPPEVAGGQDFLRLICSCVDSNRNRDFG
jgi:hypothetical protein